MRLVSTTFLAILQCAPLSIYVMHMLGSKFLFSTPDCLLDKVEHLHKHSSSARLEYTDTLGPTLQPRIESDLIWKRVGITRRDWRYVILIAIDSVYDFERGFSQSR